MRCFVAHAALFVLAAGPCSLRAPLLHKPPRCFGLLAYVVPTLTFSGSVLTLTILLCVGLQLHGTAGSGRGGCEQHCQ